MLVGKEIGPFLIERELGSGAMGSVYRAVYSDAGQRVALKFIAISQLGNETAIKRMEREANILKQMRHPNIVRLIAHGRYKKTPFIAMEYIEGESLDRILARRGAFPWEEVVAIGRQLCAALRHAHEKGVIHRDLKPSNLMILKDGTVKLTDFGIAKDTDVTALTAANSTVGTAAYMSPEQCKGERNLSAKSDLYSMGVMFYELLTGRKPFVADSPIDMFQAHVFGTFERPSRVVLDIPVWLDTLVCQLLEKKPEHRPFDAAMVDKVLGEVEEKVASQQSAGVDAVTARAIDRGAAPPDDQTDRAAARSLRAAVTKKKLRKRTLPFAQRKWVKAVGLLTALAIMAGVAVWAFRPLSADQLYARAKTAVEANDFDRALTAIGRYLTNYETPDDSRAQELREARARLMIERRERQLHKRFFSRFNFKAEDDGERLAQQALKAENEGKLNDARAAWKEMANAFSDADDPNMAVYAWLARKKLAGLANLPAREERLRDALSRDHAGESPELNPVERACLGAWRAEQFGDLPLARDRWVKVRDDNLADLETRLWAVLAADHARMLEATAVAGRDNERAFRLQLLQERWAKAEQTPAEADPAERHRTVGTCRDIIALYANDPNPEVSAFAVKAKELLRSRKW